MKYRLSTHRTTMRLMATTAAGCCAFFSAFSPVSAQQVSDAAWVEQTFEERGLTGGEIIEVLPHAVATGGLRVTIPLDGIHQTIELEPFSVRSPNYQVLVQIADGSFQEVAPGPEHNFRGHIVGMDGSAVAATYDETGFRGKLLLPDGSRRWIEPLAGQAASANDPHVLYHDDDLAGHDRTCGEPLLADDEQIDQSDGATAGDFGLYIAELAVDTDFEYFLMYGSVTGVENQVNTVINAMNVQFERDVQIRHLISTIMVRSTFNDPYSSSDAGTMLSQFRNHWNTNHAAVQRDVAQLFTGKDIDSNVIGIAYLGHICTSSSYGVAQSNFTSTLAYKTDLSAHELGHNWNAEHCACTNPPTTMNPSITGANVFHASLSSPSIISYRNTRTCLEQGDELLRIILSASATTLEMGQSAQLSAVADFRYGPDQDVTAQSVWTLDRPEFASLSPEGLLTALYAQAESCVVVNASYTMDSVTRTARLEIKAKNPDIPLTLISSSPPEGAIDARRPNEFNGIMQSGWNSFDLKINSEPCSMLPSRFEIIQDGGTQTPPSIQSIDLVAPDVIRISLSKPINPGAWTTIKDTLSEISLTVGYLPGDVDASGSATPSDILALIDSLNGLKALPVWSTDIDRSGEAAPTDILILIDLLNGASGSVTWNNVSLPR